MLNKIISFAIILLILLGTAVAVHGDVITVLHFMADRRLVSVSEDESIGIMSVSHRLKPT